MVLTQYHIVIIIIILIIIIIIIIIIIWFIPIIWFTPTGDGIRGSLRKNPGCA